MGLKGLMPRFHPKVSLRQIPLGMLVITILAAASTLIVLLRPSDDPEGILMWTFINTRAPVYREIVETMEQGSGSDARIELVEFNALRRRILSGFSAGTPLADLLEVEREIASPTWRGPVEAVGFIDLKPRLEAEGLLDKINPASFSPWTNRGRIYGLPGDVHPTLLCYRADVFEAAGIDVSELDTWEKFFAATRHLVRDFNRDGQADQYVFEMQETTSEVVRALLLQAGGGLFDADDRPVLNSPLNVRVLARMADWGTGEDRVTGDLDFSSGAGNRLRAEGYVLSWLVPDWRAHHTRLYIGSLAGKLKLMPLPAWEEEGRRTTALGGTMLGIPRTSRHIEESWEFAKRLYLSPELAVRSWREFGVLTPVKAFWDHPLYSEPDPYFSGQSSGRLFIDQAPDVPVRSSSPYRRLASQELANAFNALIRFARRTGTEDPEVLEQEAADLLEEAQNNILRQMRRNVFIDLDEPEEGS